MKNKGFGSALFAICLSALLVLGGCSNEPQGVQSQVKRDFQGLTENKDFRVVGSLGESKGVVTVRNYFWYGCPHCYNLEKTSQEWRKNLPKGKVNFIFLPVSMGSKRWEIGARFALSLHMQHLSEAEHDMVFDAIFKEKLNVYDKDALITWAGRNGWSLDRLRADWDSKEVTSAIEKLDKEAAFLNLPGTPGLLIDGKYVLDGNNGMPENLSKSMEVIVKTLMEEKR